MKATTRSTPHQPRRTTRAQAAVALAGAVLLSLFIAACGSETEPAAQTDEPASQDGVTQAPPTVGVTPTATPTPEPDVVDGPPAPTATPQTVERPTPTAPRPTGQTGGFVGDLAPEFTSISNWVNSEPLTMAGLRGKVVLIDFWTYTCINCIRTMPFLREWQEKYAAEGLVIVGVHSPEFDFEKLTPNVEKATDEFMLEYAVAQDNEFGTWRAYNNRFWPAKYLVDKDGVIRYTHFGEGAYDDTERHIRDLLIETGRNLSGIAVNDDSGPTADPRAFTADFEERITREIYGGWDRNNNPQGLYIAHQKYYDGPRITSLYADPGNHANQFLYLKGSWRSDLESITHGRATENYEDYLALYFFARSVNAVVDFMEGAEPFEVQVTYEGRPLRPDEVGSDMVVEDGRSYFTVGEGRLYEVVSLPEYGEGELTFSSNSTDFGLYALTFGAYADIS